MERLKQLEDKINSLEIKGSMINPMTMVSTPVEYGYKEDIKPKVINHLRSEFENIFGDDRRAQFQKYKGRYYIIFKDQIYNATIRFEAHPTKYNRWRFKELKFTKNKNLIVKEPVMD